MALFANGKKVNIGLCLGGGGARGFAHIGALRAFIEEGLTFDMVAGTSVGSLVGGLYAAGVSPETMQEIGEKIDLKEVHSGFKPNDPLKIGALVAGVIGEKNIEDLDIPMYIVAVDLVTARQVILDRGPLTSAVSASCAVPLFFRPMVIGDLHLVDGGLLNNIPADILRMMGCDHVVTVDINPTRGSGTGGIGVVDTLKGALSIVTAMASQTGLINSDVIIAPDMSRFSATKKSGHDEMIAEGYKAAKQKMPEIKALFGIKDKSENEEVLTERQQKIAHKKALKTAKKIAKQDERLDRIAAKKSAKSKDLVKSESDENSQD